MGQSPQHEATQRRGSTPQNCFLAGGSRTNSKWPTFGSSGSGRKRLSPRGCGGCRAIATVQPNCCSTQSSPLPV